MSNTSPPGQPGGPGDPGSDRLNSWKDIAVYLGKGVRTVQRWEVQMGLPIHRIRRESGEIAYALKSEIDAWMLGGGLAVAGEVPELDSRNEGAIEQRKAWPPTPASREGLLQSTEDVADSIDERISKLDSVRRDLKAAMMAVDELQEEAKRRSEEAEKLRTHLTNLRRDTQVAESMGQEAQEAVVGFLARAMERSRPRGWIEGLLIGFVSGFLSSALVWYLTS